MGLTPSGQQAAARLMQARIGKRVKQLSVERDRLYTIMHGDQGMIDMAIKVEEAKIRVCNQRFQQREAALSHRSALSYYVRSLYYATLRDVLMGTLDGDETTAGFFAPGEDAMHSLARRQIRIEDEWAASVEREHPINLYWNDNLLVSGSEYRLVAGIGWNGRALRMAGQVTEASHQKAYDEIRYHVLMVTSYYDPSQPWVESPVDFYSRDDAKAWAEEFMRKIHKGPDTEEAPIGVTEG